MSVIAHDWRALPTSRGLSNTRYAAPAAFHRITRTYEPRRRRRNRKCSCQLPKLPIKFIPARKPPRTCRETNKNKLFISYYPFGQSENTTGTDSTNKTPFHDLSKPIKIDKNPIFIGTKWEKKNEKILKRNYANRVFLAQSIVRLIFSSFRCCLIKFCIAFDIFSPCENLFETKLVFFVNISIQQTIYTWCNLLKLIRGNVRVGFIHG